MNTTDTSAPKVTRCKSILPNSAPHILKPIKTNHGTLQVGWIAEIDAHGLFYTYDETGSTCLLATHHNGHSLHNLAERITKSGCYSRVREQAEYIRECGGMTTGEEAFKSFFH
jgi:hypothetical protein